MKNDVFITGTSCYFPNKPVSNEDMEEFLGLIAGKHSRVKPVILKQNGIKQRYTFYNAKSLLKAFSKLVSC